MEEEKKQQNSLEINMSDSKKESAFSGWENLKLKDLETNTSAQSVIFQLNTEESNSPQKEEVNIDQLGLRIQPIEYTKQEKIEFGSSGIIDNLEYRHKYHNHYRRLFLFSFFVILVSSIFSIILRLYSKYLYIASQPIPDATYQRYLDVYKQGRNTIEKLLHINKKYTSMSLEGEEGKENMLQLIQDKKLSFIQKKEILQQAINAFSNIFINNVEQLTTLKQGVSKYGFFSQELYYLLEQEQYNISIKKYLLSLEVIKFSSAIHVFSYLDTFVASLANALKVPVSLVQEKMQWFAKRGEKDILVYLNNCYLNPYEIDYECNMIGDFDRYYDLIDKEIPRPDTNFFKKMMYYVDNKLEQTDIPSFSITFKKYDPTQKQISFTVDVNTFKQDEIALIKKGIINPHIFILSNLLNLIKQSVFVVSEHIDAKSIKITPKTIKIGTSVFTVNNSTLDFVLPIQKGSEREISDYIDPTFISSQ